MPRLLFILCISFCYLSIALGKCQLKERFSSSDFLANQIKVIIQKMNQNEIDKMMPTPSKNILKDINRDKSGVDAELRIAQWIEMLKNPKNSQLPTQKKLELVNNFFNQIPYESDDLRWKRSDYWATPYEILTNNAADCEDYAIAKYLTLRKLGVPEEKLRLTVVYSAVGKSNHMVLSYREKSGETPLVLDNNSKRIRKTNELSLYYVMWGFNNQSVWKIDPSSKKWEEDKKNIQGPSKWEELKKRLLDHH